MPRVQVLGFGATWRGLRVIAHVLSGALILVGFKASRLLRLDDGWTSRTVCWWHRRLCHMLRLQVSVVGARDESALLVANHISWLDVPVLGSLGRITFLSKSEVRAWPLIGWMSVIAGTLFIERGASQMSGLVASILASMRARRAVVIFPEGTTSDGRELRRFHPRLFAVVQHPDARAQPVALRYGSNVAPDPIAPFIGEDTLVAHLIRVLRHPGIKVQVTFLPAVEGADLDRRTLADRCRNAVADTLGIARAPMPQAKGRASAAGAASSVDATDFEAR